ncbi:helix-turn-helix domain-containing protein [Bremerella sp. JC770]|uniref:helix-turn-helix domain-containing protein n=1 Tax=Bremerella sp. JC770 TaxID=3232137 RepID=UPI003457D38B
MQHTIDVSTNATEASSATEEPILVGADKAAPLLSISRRLLWTLTQAGEIPHTRIRNRVLYSPRKLREWIDRQSQGGAA